MTAEELSLLLEELEDIPADGTILEIGTAAGGTLVKVLEKLRPEDRKRVAAVDTFDYYEDHLGIFRKNLSENGFDPDRIDARVARSTEAFVSARKNNEKLSFVIVDGSHKMKHVTQDLRWLGLLAVGGKAALHDYTEHLPGVRMAVDKFVLRNANYRVKAKAGSLVILEKTAATTWPEVTTVDLVSAYFWSVVIQNRKSLNKIIGYLMPASRR